MISYMIFAAILALTTAEPLLGQTSLTQPQVPTNAITAVDRVSLLNDLGGAEMLFNPVSNPEVYSLLGQILDVQQLCTNIQNGNFSLTNCPLLQPLVAHLRALNLLMDPSITQVAQFENFMSAIPHLFEITRILILDRNLGMLANVNFLNVFSGIAGGDATSVLGLGMGFADFGVNSFVI